MTRESTDPTVIRSIAVRADDLVSAVEAARRTGKATVLRITPPFSGRMRARLHVGDVESATDPAPIHVDPESLLADSAPAYPTPSETEDALRADPAVEYTQDRHHDRHADAVADWRRSLDNHAVDTVTLETSGDQHEVEVALLG